MLANRFVMRLFLGALSAISLTACLPQNAAVPPTEPAETEPSETEAPSSTSAPPASPTPIATAETPDASLPPLGYTNQRPDGNRLIAGSAEMLTTPPIDLELAGQPEWITAIPLSDTATLWGIVLSDGFTQAFIVDGTQATPVAITPPVLANAAPLLGSTNGEAFFLLGTTNDPGGNHPVPLTANGELAYSDANGNLFVIDSRHQTLAEPDFTLMADNRMLVDERGRLLLLTDPTERYDHGVLGNGIEASTITLLDPFQNPPAQITITPPNGKVIEGIAPIWTDWNGDGEREIIVTLADSAEGANIALFNEAGEMLASGPSNGQGYRWRHQIAVAPFGPNGELELVDVRTPHLNGVVEFYRWNGDALEIVASVDGYTSHVIGSPNLDMAAAGDFDGDGRVELLLPTQNRLELAAIQHSAEGATAVWSLPLPDQMVSNVAAATLPNGQTVVGIGLANNTLRIWPVMP